MKSEFFSKENSFKCIICGGDTKAFPKKLYGNTSAGSGSHSFTLLQCQACWHIQKKVDIGYTTEIEEIYKINYNPSTCSKKNYKDGKVLDRNVVLAQSVLKQFPNCEYNNLAILDYGCGAGDLLVKFSELAPETITDGIELNGEDDGYTQNKKIRIYNHPQSTSNKYDAIIFNHVMEHITNPVEVLSECAELLKPNGLIFTIVPSYEKIYSDLFFYEHCSHFRKDTLQKLASEGGLIVERFMDDVVNAVEIGVIMSQRNTHAFDPHKQVEWTLSLTKRIKEQAGKGKFAIFGLGGPGMYIANEMSNQVAYIIDDDPTKQATEYCDIRIIPLKEADPKIDVFVAMNNPEASLIMRDKILSRREELCVIAL